MRDLESRYGREALVAALRHAAEDVRSRAAAGETIDDAAACVEEAAALRLAAAARPSLTRVINATGVVLHTNLGRAPLAAAAIARIAELAAGYTNLEYDLAAGRRGRRDVHAERLLVTLTGAEAAVVVNNNAAATMLVLAALARGREAIVSRGELVEIGGGFRVPDVMAQSGTVLREVGTTNRTRAADYAAAISDKTAVILRVHPSNFRIDGFTERPALEDLVTLGRRFGVPVVEDLGSGWFADGEAAPGIPADEPDVRASVRAGADVVMFSGDKLLGGPQAGIIAGRAEVVGVIRRHPLMRALRVDKLTYAALEATLAEHVAGRAAATVPAVRMLRLPDGHVRDRARALAARLLEAGWQCEVVAGASTAGGGSAPGSEIPTALLAVPGEPPDALAARLRAADPPVIARIHDGRLVIDLRTVEPADDERIIDALLRGR